jgi:hypothetical protein
VYEVPISSTPPPVTHSSSGAIKMLYVRCYFENVLIKFYKTLEVGVVSDGSWPNRTTTIIYNVIEALTMHNTERLHLPVIHCLSNDNSPMFIDPYNTGPIYIARTLRSAVYCTTVLWHAVRVLYCIILYSTAVCSLILCTIRNGRF